MMFVQNEMQLILIPNKFSNIDRNFWKFPVKLFFIISQMCVKY